VTLFGRGPENPLSGAAVDTALVYYTDGDPERGSVWLGFGMLTPKGKVRTLMCTACQRFFFYGAPL
jgi:hypothetical protein